MFAFLGWQVEKDVLVVSLALGIDAAKSHVRVIAIQHAVDVCANHVTFLGQRVEQLLQPLQTCTPATYMVVFTHCLPAAAAAAADDDDDGSRVSTLEITLRTAHDLNHYYPGSNSEDVPNKIRTRLMTRMFQVNFSDMHKGLTVSSISCDR